MKKHILTTLYFLSSYCFCMQAQDYSMKIVLYGMEPDGINNKDLQKRVSTATSSALCRCGHEVRFNEEWGNSVQSATGAIAMEAEILDIIHKASKGLIDKIDQRYNARIKKRLKKLDINTVVFVSLVRNLADKSREYEVRVHIFDHITLNYRTETVITVFTAQEIEDIGFIEGEICRALYEKGACYSLFQLKMDDPKEQLKKTIELIARLRLMLPNDSKIQVACKRLQRHPKTKLLYWRYVHEYSMSQAKSYLDNGNSVEPVIHWLVLALESAEALRSSFASMNDKSTTKKYERIIYELEQQLDHLKPFTEQE